MPKQARSFHFKIYALLSALIVLLLVVVGYDRLTQKYPIGPRQDITLTRGGYLHVTKQLQEDGLLQGFGDKELFLLAASLTAYDGQLQAGEFHLPAHVSMMDIMGVLRHGHTVIHKLTIPEGVTAYQLEKIFAQTPYMTGGISPLYEGEILPQTYRYRRDTARELFIVQKHIAMETILARLWQARAPKVALNIPQELLILASLVEKETSIPSEKPLIAAVILNRLKAHMKLQVDPSVIYGLNKGQDFKRKLTHEDLHIDTPYNSYLHEGLPPTAICFPGEESLRAAAFPAQDNEVLYFVANGHGGHSFTSSYKIHEENIRRLRAVKDPQNSQEHHP